MTLWISAIGVSALAVVGLRFWYRRWRTRRISARRKVELPNSHYSSRLVQNQLDRDRWHDLKLSRLHPVNQEEVERLLAMVDALGADTLSPRERIFLDHLTSLRLG